MASSRTAMPNTAMRSAARTQAWISRIRFTGVTYPALPGLSAAWPRSVVMPDPPGALQLDPQQARSVDHRTPHGRLGVERAQRARRVEVVGEGGPGRSQPCRTVAVATTD